MVKDGLTCLGLKTSLNRPRAITLQTKQKYTTNLKKVKALLAHRPNMAAAERFLCRLFD